MTDRWPYVKIESSDPSVALDSRTSSWSTARVLFVIGKSSWWPDLSIRPSAYGCISFAVSAQRCLARRISLSLPSW